MVPRDDVGSDPDYRFSLANERTFLAWIRTALGLLAGGGRSLPYSTTWVTRPCGS